MLLKTLNVVLLFFLGTLPCSADTCLLYMKTPDDIWYIYQKENAPSLVYALQDLTFYDNSGNGDKVTVTFSCENKKFEPGDYFAQNKPDMKYLAIFSIPEEVSDTIYKVRLSGAYFYYATTPPITMPNEGQTHCFKGVLCDNETTQCFSLSYCAAKSDFIRVKKHIERLIRALQFSRKPATAS